MPSESRNPELKSCYLAGPMRGYPQYNFPAFFTAAAALRERGYEVWSPAENDVHADGFNPVTDTAQPMRHYMKRDLPAVLNADFVAVLPGWEKSQGAQLEVHVARTCGIPVLNAGDLSPATPSETATKEMARLREIEHRIWHVLDDSEEDARTGNINIVPGDDYFKLCDLLPEDHPEVPTGVERPEGKS